MQVPSQASGTSRTLRALAETVEDGAEGIRTLDPLVAKQIEHKLSYDTM